MGTSSPATVPEYNNCAFHIYYNSKYVGSAGNVVLVAQLAFADSDPTSNSVPEGSAAGTHVGITLPWVYPNDPLSVTYSVNNSAFQVQDPTSGVVTVKNGSLLSYENPPSRMQSVTITASDVTSGGETTVSATYTINVSAVGPTAPADADTADANTVAEGATAGATVGITAQSTSPGGEPVNYSITGVTGNNGLNDGYPATYDGSGLFAISNVLGSAGIVTVASGAQINYAKAQSFSVTVKATQTDGGQLSATNSFTVAVTPVALPPPADADTADANTVAEGAAAGATVGITAQSTSPGGEPVNYSITGVTGNNGLNDGYPATYDGSGLFAISNVLGSAGIVTVAGGAQINYAKAQSFSVTVKATQTDGGLLSATNSFTITVTPAAPMPPADADTADANTVAEGAAAGTLAGITAQSTSPGSEPVSYSITSVTGNNGLSDGYPATYNPAGLLTIDPVTGVVTVANGSLISYAKAQTYTVTVEATQTDGGQLSSTNSFAINVTPTAPPAPGNDLNSGNNTVSIQEGATGGAAVGIQAFATSPAVGESVMYRLTDNAGGEFSIDPATGVITVAQGVTLSYAAATSYAVAVQALDSYGGFSGTTMFTINVTKSPPSTPVNLGGAQTVNVLEQAADGTLTGITAYSTDPEKDAITYSLTNNPGGRFAINSTTGVVTVANGGLIKYSDGSYSITVQASDPEGNTAAADFTINVNSAQCSVRSLSVESRSSIRRPSERASTAKLTCRLLAR